jgi:hypothetical protein
MNYAIYRLIDVPRDDKGRIHKRLKTFWDDKAETRGIDFRTAVGCYVFSIGAGRGELPWYAGLAEKGFGQECFTVHKRGLLNGILQSRERSKLNLTLLVKLTPKKKPAKPSKVRLNKKANRASDIRFLEQQLIAHCYRRNEQLLNIANTRYLKDMVVPGLLNTPRGKPAAETRELLSLLGLDD